MAGLIISIPRWKRYAITMALLAYVSFMAWAGHPSRMSHAWYHTSAWRKRRKGQLIREPLCRMCKAMGRVTPATIADHIEPHRGDRQRFWRGELQSLCGPCHSSAKQADEARGYSLMVDDRGMPTDPNHPARAYTRGDGS